ncbi:MAG: protein kinase/transcriptional regulator, LuxR family, partial [Firmicutes bacterium]|nr:protein kinase/transcriptional regulator, LuxR family [Bacillota bacterium]
RFRLLTAGSRTAPPRQKTLRGAVDWSHELLPEPERALWRRLAVFAGGFTLAAAETVCAQADLPQDDVLALLHRLVDKSLVIADEQGGERRFRMLDTLREYGLEKLRAAGEETAVRSRHYDWCLALAQAVAAQQWGPQWAVGYDRLEREHDNLRAALEGCRSTQVGAARGVRLAWTLLHFWDTWGHVQEGRQRVAELLTLAADPPVRALALTLAGSLATCHGDFRDAARSGEAGLAIWVMLGDQLGQARCLIVLGLAAHLAGELDRAVPLLEESLTLFRAVDDGVWVRHTLYYLAEALIGQGDYRRARSLHEECLALRRAAGDRVLPFSLLRLAHLAILEGDPARALALGRESFPLWEPRFKRGLAFALEIMGAIAITVGQAERAVCLVGAADRIRRSSGLGADTGALADREQLLAAAAARLGEEAYAAAWSQGQSLSPEQATAYALGLG